LDYDRSELNLKIYKNGYTWGIDEVNGKCEYNKVQCIKGFTCQTEEEIVKPKTWKIIEKHQHWKNFFKRNYEYNKMNNLFVFYLLPQTASFQHVDGKDIIKKSINGPKCQIQFRFVSQNLFKKSNFISRAVGTINF
jgi:hypothetical protein